MAIKNLDEDITKSIYGKLMFTSKTSNSKSEVLDAKTVTSISNNLTTLQNVLNTSVSAFGNINKLTQYENTRIERNNREETIETRSTSGSMATSSMADFSVIVGAFGALSKKFEELSEKLSEMDLSCGSCDTETTEDSTDVDDDIDKKKKKKKGPKGGRRRTKAPKKPKASKRVKTSKLGRGIKGIGGRALGIFGAGLDVFDRLSEGQSGLQTAVGVGGGLAGAAAGAKLGATGGAAVGAFFGGIGAGPGAAIGGFLGGAAGYFGGSSLADSAYNAISKPAISETSYSSQLSDFISKSVEIANSYSIFGGSGGGGGGGGGATGEWGGDARMGLGSSENAHKAMAYFMSKEGGGWTKEQAAGIVGNLQQESTKNLDPNSFRKNDAGPGKHSYGLAQWNRDRYDNLIKYTKSKNKPWNDFQTQLEFINWEFNNTHKAAADKIRKTTSAIDAANITNAHYEGSADRSNKRANNAMALLETSSKGPQTQLTGGQLMNPLAGSDYRASSEFGKRESPGGIGSTDHKGLDLAAAMGTPIKAAGGGTVTLVNSKDDNALGIYVVIDHGNGLVTKYGHMSKHAVNKNMKVAAGQIIGYIGKTGTATGPHLHFVVEENGKQVNPRPYLTKAAQKSTKDKAKPTLQPSQQKLKEKQLLLLEQAKKRKTKVVVVPIEKKVPVPVSNTRGGQKLSSLSSGNPLSRNYYG